MFSVCGYCLAIFSLLLSSGGHWLVLQGAAWTGMVVQYSQSAGISRGMAMTFDGEHPCPLCQAISRGQEQEQEQKQNDTPANSQQDDLRQLKISQRNVPALIDPCHARTPARGWIFLSLTSQCTALPETPPPEIAA